MPVLPWATRAIKENIIFPRYIAVSLCVCRLRLCMMRQLIAFETVTMKSPFLKHESILQQKEIMTTLPTSSISTPIITQILGTTDNLAMKL